MKMRAWISVAVVCCAVGLTAGTAFTDDPAPTPEDMVKEMLEKEKPGEMHALLASFAGTWDVDVKMWMGPGDPTTSKAVSTNHMILGGRYLQSDYKGTFMDMPFDGQGTMGFNNFKQRFESSWISNMGTPIYSQASEGPSDGKTIVLLGEYDGPMGKMPTRMVWTKVDEDTWTMESFATMQGQEIQEMAMRYTRRAASDAKPAASRGACCPAGTKGPGY